MENILMESVLLFQYQPRLVFLQHRAWTKHKWEWKVFLHGAVSLRLLPMGQQM